MKVKIIEKKGNLVRFDIEGITPALAGELRHIMISEIPTMAIEVVDFYKNQSFLWNEVLANRLGLIPLAYDKKYHKLKENCTCKGKGCAKCQVHLVIKRKGPGTVHSGDLKSSDDKVKPLYDNIPLTELLEDQELELEAIAQLGLGKDHAKWQGAVVGYEEGSGKFTFVVESASGLKVKDIIKMSIEILDSKLNDFSGDVAKLK
jgi:DNA-directed RNA polymerase subunit D